MAFMRMCFSDIQPQEHSWARVSGPLPAYDWVQQKGSFQGDTGPLWCLTLWLQDSLMDSPTFLTLHYRSGCLHLTLPPSLLHSAQICTMVWPLTRAFQSLDFPSFPLNSSHTVTPLIKLAHLTHLGICFSQDLDWCNHFLTFHILLAYYIYLLLPTRI